MRKAEQHFILVFYRLEKWVLKQARKSGKFCKEFITINSNDLKAFIKELKSDVGEINQLHFLTHIQPTTIFEIPAREFYLKTLSKNFKNAEAIITENISQQFILETLLDKQKIDIPVKIFSGREEAFLWLSQISTKK